MKLLMLIFFAGYSVRCDESNYHIKPQIRKPFKVYWNVPTNQCRDKDIKFENLFDKFGIIQNSNDDFRGDKISILYDPGLFPALKDNASGELVAQNGGVPQKGNLTEHLSSFRNILNQSIPNSNFSEVGVIDFEAWRPAFRQHFGKQSRYKTVSYDIEKNEMNTSEAEVLAKINFEKAARLFMENTLFVAKQMRSNAQWGYYGFPYCFNGIHNGLKHCSKEVSAENDGISWLWSESTALYPSVYSSKNLTSAQLEQFIRGRVSEAARVRKNGAAILPYFRFNYLEGPFLSEVDLQTALKTFNESEASGFIIWGSSNDVNTVDKCVKLLNYTEKVMGPAIAKYTKNTKDNAGEEVPLDNCQSNTCNYSCLPDYFMFLVTIVSLVITWAILIWTIYVHKRK